MLARKPFRLAAHCFPLARRLCPRERDCWPLAPCPPPVAVGPVLPAAGAFSYIAMRTRPAARRASARWNAQAGRDAPANFTWTKETRDVAEPDRPEPGCRAPETPGCRAGGGGDRAGRDGRAGSGPDAGPGQDGRQVRGLRAPEYGSLCREPGR